jgi:hypothetical protein
MKKIQTIMEQIGLASSESATRMNRSEGIVKAPGMAGELGNSLLVVAVIFFHMILPPMGSLEWLDALVALILP